MSAPAELLGWVARAEEDFTLAPSALWRKKPLTVWCDLPCATVR